MDSPQLRSASCARCTSAFPSWMYGMDRCVCWPLLSPHCYAAGTSTQEAAVLMDRTPKWARDPRPPGLVDRQDEAAARDLTPCQLQSIHNPYAR